MSHFDVGQIVVSRRVLKELSDETIAQLVKYHSHGETQFIDEKGTTVVMSRVSSQAKLVESYHDVTQGKIVVSTDRFERLFTQIYFCEEADDKRRGYFAWHDKGRQKTMSLGRILMTQGVNEALRFDTISNLITKQLTLDWGDSTREDWFANNQALSRRERVVSMHNVEDTQGENERVFVITEADRNSTIIMMASEY